MRPDMEYKGNEQILKYFSGIKEIAETINKSYSYTQRRIKRTNGVDFTEGDWKKINEHIDEYKRQKSKHTKEDNKQEIATLIKKLIDELAE